MKRFFAPALGLALVWNGLLAVTASAAEAASWNIGIQTWTLRNLNFQQAVDFCVKHKIKYVQLIDKHLSPFATLDEMTRKKAILDKHGLIFYTFGVAKTSNDPKENQRLFDFAKFMEIKVIIVEPSDLKQWDNLEELVKKYDIKLAIHNHGLSSTYGNPATVKKILGERDRRIGVCLDVGHLAAAGFDAAKTFREYDGRVYDIHLKDKKVEKAGEKEVATDVEIGQGAVDYPALFAELHKAKWNGVLAIETDSNIFATNPDKFVAGAIEFAKQYEKPAPAR
jgi:sugar phosphate isomerase/epimerase